MSCVEGQIYGDGVAKASEAVHLISRTGFRLTIEPLLGSVDIVSMLIRETNGKIERREHEAHVAAARTCTQ